MPPHFFSVFRPLALTPNMFCVFVCLFIDYMHKYIYICVHKYNQRTVAVMKLCGKVRKLNRTGWGQDLSTTKDMKKTQVKRGFFLIYL